MRNNDPQGSEDYNHLFKIVLVGDAAVGKTHLLNRYVRGSLPRSNVPTIGVEFATKTVTLPDGGKIKTQIWDTAGQERYRAITSAHYRRAQGALLVYDVTKEKTFESVLRWMEELKTQADPDIVIILVANKVDLVEKDRTLRRVDSERAQQLAYENGMLFEETSALTSQNVTHVFERLLQEIYDKKADGRPISHNGVTLSGGQGNKDSKCC